MRWLGTCPQAKMSKSGHAIFFSFFDASERRVWLSPESKILASTFGRFRLYRLKKVSLKIFMIILGVQSSKNTHLDYKHPWERSEHMFYAQKITIEKIIIFHENTKITNRLLWKSVYQLSWKILLIDSFISMNFATVVFLNNCCCQNFIARRPSNK